MRNKGIRILLISDDLEVQTFCAGFFNRRCGVFRKLLTFRTPGPEYLYLLHILISCFVFVMESPVCDTRYAGHMILPAVPLDLDIVKSGYIWLDVQ